MWTDLVHLLSEREFECEFLSLGATSEFRFEMCSLISKFFHFPDSVFFDMNLLNLVDSGCAVGFLWIFVFSH